MSEADRSDPSPPRGERPGPEFARSAGLRYVDGFEVGIRRRRCGSGFSYRSASGRLIRSQRQRERIDRLAIPPAWQDVWICPRPDGHIQAVGRDGEGRLQYIYHDRWHAISAAAKYERMYLMAELLPRIRRRVRRDLKADTLTRERVVAAAVRLLDKAHLRVGNESYARQHGSRGVTTLTADHVEVEQFHISLSFPAKSGTEHEVEFRDQLTAEVVRECEEIDGHFLFCYRDDEGALQSISSTDVNQYLGAITDEAITAKDFRTWWGSVRAMAELVKVDAADLTPAQRRRALSGAMARTAAALGNTPAVCRASYVHPGLPALFEAGSLARRVERAAASAEPRAEELTADERRLVALLPELPMDIGPHA